MVGRHLKHQQRFSLLHGKNTSWNQLPFEQMWTKTQRIQTSILVLVPNQGLEYRNFPLAKIYRIKQNQTCSGNTRQGTYIQAWIQFPCLDFFKVSEHVGEVSKCQNLNCWFSLFTRFQDPKAPGLVRGLLGHYELLTLQWAGRPVTLGLLSVRKVYCTLVCCNVLGFILAHEDEYVNGSNNWFIHFIWRVGKKQEKHEICKWLGEWQVLQHLSTHTCSTWNPSDPCLGRKRPCFKGFTFKNKGL